MAMNRRLLIIYLFLTVITCAVFYDVGNLGFLNFDDDVYITANSHIRDGISVQALSWAFTTGDAANWHPITWISHMLDVRIFGLNPRWHHLTNLLFHLANTLLLFFVLHRMTRALWQSAFVAALFALHPLHVESVAWASERKDVLSALFGLLTLAAYVYYTEKPLLKRYLAVVSLFALGLMAKPMLVTLPFLLLLLDYWPLERWLDSKPAQVIRSQPAGAVPVPRKKRKARKQASPVIVEIEQPANRKLQWRLIRPLLLEKIPLFALAILSCVVTYIAQKKGGAFAPVEICTFGLRMANALVSYPAYIAKMLWPENLAMLYPFPGALPLWQVLGAAFFLTAVTLAVLRPARRFPYLPVGWFWFTGTLVPVIGIVQVGVQSMADRYTYIPSIGLFIMAAWGIPQIFKKWRFGKKALATLATISLTCLAGLTYTQVGYWRDGMTLFNHTLDVTQDNFTIYTSRGRIYQDLGDYRRAIADYDEALRISPRNSLALNNRGNCWNSLGNRARAIQDLDRSIEINPLKAETYNNRGLVYSAVGNYARAIEDFSRAIAIDPESAQSFNNRGVSYAASGNGKQASEDFERAVAVDPHYAEAYFNLGIFYLDSGRFHEAVDDFSRAIANNSGYGPEVFYNRGLAYAGLGDHKKAVEDYDTAIRIDPRYEKAYLNRGLAYSALNDHVRAARDFDTAIQIAPKDGEAYYYRAKAHASAGNSGKELEDMKTAARLGSKDARNVLKNLGADW